MLSWSVKPFEVLTLCKECPVSNLSLMYAQDLFLKKVKILVPSFQIQSPRLLQHHLMYFPLSFSFLLHFCHPLFSFLSWKLGYTLIFIWNPAFHKLWVGFQVIVFLPCQWNYSFHYFPICPLVLNLNSYPIIVSSMSDFWHFPPFFFPSLSYILWAMSIDYLLGYVRARDNWASISFGFRQA